MFDQLDIAHARGRPQVIHDRVRLIESFRGEDVFVGDAFVLVGRRRAVAMKPDVMLLRNLTELLIIRHVALPPLSCCRAGAPPAGNRCGCPTIRLGTGESNVISSIMTGVAS